PHHTHSKNFAHPVYPIIAHPGANRRRRPMGALRIVGQRGVWYAFTLWFPQLMDFGKLHGQYALDRSVEAPHAVSPSTAITGGRGEPAVRPYAPYIAKFVIGA